MDNLEWRFRARVVACFGLVLSIMAVVYVIFLTFGAAVVLYHLYNSAAIWVAFLCVVLLDIMAVVELWTSLKLLSATEKGKPTGEALQKSRIWLNVNVVLLVISAITSLFSIYFANRAAETIILIIGYILSYGIYFILMFIVFKFIQELETVVNSGDSAVNNLDCVYVK